MVIKLNSMVYGFKHTLYKNNKIVEDFCNGNDCVIETKADFDILKITLISEECIKEKTHTDKLKEFLIFFISAPFTYNFYNFNIYNYQFRFDICADNFDNVILYITIDDDIDIDDFGRINIRIDANNGKIENMETICNVDEKIAQYHFNALKKNRLYVYIALIFVFTALLIVGVSKSSFGLILFSVILMILISAANIVGYYTHRKMYKKFKNLSRWFN